MSPLLKPNGYETTLHLGIIDAISNRSDFMIAFYFIQLAAYLFYSRSKYFPQNLPKISKTWVTSCVGTVLLILGTGVFIRSDGWAGGLIFSLTASSLAMILVQLFVVVGRVYFYGFIALIHGLLLINLLSNAG